jgi:pimeloyl-ACP methyl ester carboxylesterase
MKRAVTTGTDKSAAAPPRVRRGYFDCRFGQLHVHNAMPPGGGFDENTALLCLHDTASSGRVFRPFLEIMGRDRSVYAPDLPGHGESDPPPSTATVEDHAHAVTDFMRSMRFRQVDLLGHRTGAAVATEVAIANPQQVRRVVLVAVPAADGEGAATLRYPLKERLALITQPVTVLRPRDDLWDATQRARDFLPRARLVELADQGPAVFDSAPQAVADAVRDFLKG